MSASVEVLVTEETNGSKTSLDKYFFHLVATFEAAAMQQLGKIAHPLTGEVGVSLEGARDSIDMLGMLKRKCAGNLNDDETRLLEHVLHQLRMNYVDVAAEKSDGSDGAGDDDEAGDAGDGRENAAGDSEDSDGSSSTGSDGKAGDN